VHDRIKTPHLITDHHYITLLHFFTLNHIHFEHIRVVATMSDDYASVEHCEVFGSHIAGSRNRRPAAPTAL
jgi:hypothetical protein